MGSTIADELPHPFTAFFRIYKDKRIERLAGEEYVPPSTHPVTGVQWKDVIISPENNISGRLFLPRLIHPAQKLPLLIYVHGGAFCVGSSFSTMYTTHLNALAAEANAVALSVNYRRAPEHLLPVAHDDIWTTVQWVATQGSESEPWLKDHADLDRVFLAGDSAGANITHYSLIRAGVDKEKLGRLKIVGFIAVHPFFGTELSKYFSLLDFLFPTNEGERDPRLNPAVDPDLTRMGCRRVLIFVAEKDMIKDLGYYYYEVLKKSRWDGEVEIIETEGEEHIFHLLDQGSEKATVLVKQFAAFINRD